MRNRKEGPHREGPQGQDYVRHLFGVIAQAQTTRGLDKLLAEETVFDRPGSVGKVRAAIGKEGHIERLSENDPQDYKNADLEVRIGEGADAKKYRVKVVLDRGALEGIFEDIERNEGESASTWLLRQGVMVLDANQTPGKIRGSFRFCTKRIDKHAPAANHSGFEQQQAE